MPPKKKSRIPVTPGLKSTFDRTDSSQAAAEVPLRKAPAKGKTIDRLASDEPVLNDGWTDEQETTLFKAISIYRWKPAGMHKHFRMLSISNLMANHGVMDTHTRPPGIWKKLGTLYDMKLMDEREDMDDDVLEGREPKWTEFALPEEFKEMMAVRRPELDSKSWIDPREARQEMAKGGLDNDQEKAENVEENVGENERENEGENERENVEENVEDDERKENEEETEPGESEDVGEFEGVGGEVEDGTAGDEEEIVERTQNLEVTESIAPTPRRRGNRLSGVSSPSRLPPIGNFAPPIRVRGGTQHRRARARGRGGLGGRGNTTSMRGRRSEEATPARSENLSEAPNSSSQNTEDTGETTEEEDSDAGKEGEEEAAEDPPPVPATPKRGGAGGRGRGRGRGGSGASTAVAEADSVRRSIRNK
ncbi:chromatin modification-related protein EAF7-domain-containing protein [Tirmania nivea]|nr:chromatin modification-related protein EAF7-domain-containing protein [Tirmania nivea]